MNKASSDNFFEGLEEQFGEAHPGDVAELMFFAEKIYRLYPVNELASEPCADICELLSSLRRYMDDFKGEPKIHSFNPTLEEDGWEHRYTQIFVMLKDMAFVVDSIRMALARHGLGIHSINSTVFDVERDQAGTIIQLSPEPTESSEREALVFFQVDRYVSADTHKKMVGEIATVLEEVSAVTQDYQASLSQLAEIRNKLSERSNEFEEESLSEILAFLDWLGDNHYTFLGYSYYSFSQESDPLVCHRVEGQLGLFRDKKRTDSSARLSSLAPGCRDFYASSEIVALAKSNIRSRVHRDAYCEYVVIKDFNLQGKVLGEHRFLGLYTSLVYTQSPFSFPLVRLKLRHVYQRTGLNPTGHYGKVLRQVMEVHPREELLHTSEGQLFDILIGIWQINERQLVKLFISPDPFEKFITCSVYLPRENYRTEIRERTQKLLMEALDAKEVQFDTYFGESSLARTHFVLRINSNRYREVDSRALEQQIAAFTNDWRDDLHEAVIEHWGDEKGIALSERYRDAFPISYRSHFDPRTAVHDIALFDDLVDQSEIAMSFFQPPGVGPDTMRFKIFHRESELSLSRMIPLLENLGFQVIGEHPYPITPVGRKTIWMHDFNLQFSLDIAIDVPGVRDNFLKAFEAVWQEKIDDDAFNWLVIGARLDWKSVALMRLYARYIKQLGVPISQNFIASTLAKNIDITRDLVALFKSLFDPRVALQDSETTERSQRLEQKIREAIDSVHNLNEDQALRSYLQLICATVRTNFFQSKNSLRDESSIAIKIMPEKLNFVPHPRPAYEIFVYSPRFEGVHLRADKVARGGIRWSDRLEDYRTEILGLVKAQRVKNAVIVPTGAKGGFIVKKAAPGGDREALLAEGVACYELFIRSLLDLTDNICGELIEAPEAVVRRDGDDAYLVVAADKGTAQFSDLANSVAKDYGYWLQDAFASGGINGYDHKKMGITARGAWVAVQRHFRELGINIQEQDFTVIGIGDMSGDVFGNGMLLSPHICLVAAFNHASIFLDPHPDPLRSFEERKRLFERPRSAWADYNSDCISKGGGVFSRQAKAIQLSGEIKKLFEIEEDQLTPSQLINRLLKAPVDLIWNGGIGTYVKAVNESDLDVGDRANDDLRVNGKELRCRVFGEGGNLGITQRGRIEYCLNGGACNTDFIDNSGGVDCSDQEVNIKIALNKLIVTEDLTYKQRNILMEEMSDAVADKVLLHNYRQTQTISLARRRCRENPSEFWLALSDWEAAKLLDRKRENLPDDETLVDREKVGDYLTRPELSLLLSHSKIMFKEQLLATNIIEDAYIAKEINKAFPEVLSERFPSIVARHHLRREILCNQLSNEIIDAMGLTYVHRQRKSTGADAMDVVRAYITVRDVLNLESVWAELEALDYRQDTDIQADLQLSIMRLGRRSTRWFIRNRRSCINTETEVKTLKPIIGQLLTASIENFQQESADDSLEMTAYMEMGLSQYAAILIDSANDLFFAFGMADTCLRTGASMELVSTVYSQLSDILQFDWFSQQIVALSSMSRWEDFARESYMDELESQFRNLAVAMLEESDEEALVLQQIEAWQNNYQSLLTRWQEMIHELQIASVKDYALFAVALRELKDLVDTVRQRRNLPDYCVVGNN